MFGKTEERRDLHKDPPLMRQKDWERALKELLPKTTKPEDITHAAILMEHYNQAMIWIFNKLRNQGLHIIFPAIRIVSEYSNLGCDQSGKEHIVGKNLLLKYCWIDPQYIVQIASDLDKRIVFTGKMTEFFELTAIEEMAHAAYCQVVPHAKQPEKPAHTYARSLPEYDAHNMEFQSLVWRLAYARENHFSAKTIEVLVRRIKNAQIYKNARIKKQ